ncbi:hypothetical protein ACWCYZ_45840 [Streptomyces virginiae]
MITADVQHCGSSVLISAGGKLDEHAGVVFQQALDGIAVDARDLMVDLHGVVAMDACGLTGRDRHLGQSDHRVPTPNHPPATASG